MINEIHVIIGGAVGAILSGVAGLLISALGMRRTQRRRLDAHEELAWEKHQSAELARNLLVLEMLGDEIESAPLDIAVRARLTPAEMREATDELAAAGLVDLPTPDLIRLSGVGRSILADHKLELEESTLHRSQRKTAPRQRQSLADLDMAIENAVKALRSQHAHS